MNPSIDTLYGQAVEHFSRGEAILEETCWDIDSALVEYYKSMELIETILKSDPTHRKTLLLKEACGGWTSRYPKPH